MNGSHVRKNRIGEKYNLLTVKEPIEDKREPSGNLVQRFLFSCDCGKETKAAYKEVKRGKIKSCGCLTPPKIDITKENRFGKLIIIKEVDKYVSPKGEKSRKVLCRCECGVEKEYHLQSLKRGITKDCGCVRRAKRKPKEIKIIEPPKDTETEKWYQCISTDKLYLSDNRRAYSMKTGDIMSIYGVIRLANGKDNLYSNTNDVFYNTIVGEYDKNKYKIIFIDGNQNNFKPENLFLAEITNNGQDWVKRLYAAMKSNKKQKAGNRLKICTLKEHHLIEQYKKQAGLSTFLKIPLDMSMNQRLYAASVDRIDNDKDYVPGNITLVTRFENMGRGSATFDEFMEFCKNLNCG